MSELDEYDDPIPRTPNPRLWYLYGEDPARFLGRDINPRLGENDIVYCRIRGLDDPDLLDEYLKIEASVFKRQSVVGALNQRKAELKRNGGRSEQLASAFEDPDEDDEPEEPEEPTVWRHVAEDCRSTDVERVSDMALECNGCGRRVPNNRVEEVSP